MIRPDPTRCSRPGPRPERPSFAAALLPAKALTAALLLAALLLATLPPRLWAQEGENLLDRISNERMIAFEQQLEKDINAALRRYLSPGQYVLSVRVIWDRNVIPAIATPGLQPEKQKLPGFPIFVRSPGAPVDEKTPAFTRLVVKVLIDETLPEYYERFLRKIVPIVARFVPARGDQLIVLKETFPELNRENLPPTIPEKELMEQIGEPLPQPAGEAPPSGADAMTQARIAFDEARYSEALRIVQTGFQQATTNQQRAGFLAMEGSVFYTLNNVEAARASWKRALVYDPGNTEVHRIMNYLDQQQTAPEAKPK